MPNSCGPVRITSAQPQLSRAARKISSLTSPTPQTSFLTRSMIDAARKRAERDVLVPPGPKVAVTGGLDFNDHRLIWSKLDQVHAKHPDMVLMHGKSPKGAEKIAARWADHRAVPQIGFAPDWAKHGRAAPFKRNDQMLDVLPIGVLVFPGTGIQENLADKARKLGIPVWKFGGA